jgi:hypothetical protein
MFCDLKSYLFVKYIEKSTALLIFKETKAILSFNYRLKSIIVAFWESDVSQEYIYIYS